MRGAGSVRGRVLPGAGPRGKQSPDSVLPSALAPGGWSPRRWRGGGHGGGRRRMDGHASAHAGTLAGFGRVWRPGTHPEGMLYAYAYPPTDGGGNHRVSFWPYESCARRG